MHQQTTFRKKRMFQFYGTKTVTVVRGKLGYGFTISGEKPCMLSSIVPSSPAQLAGLKAGDFLHFVNGENVIGACHDDVVRMVGLSTGCLELQVAENFNNSDSSDDDYRPRNKSRYPNRVRGRRCTRERTSRPEKIPPSYNFVQVNSSERQGQYELSSSLTSHEDHNWPDKAGTEWVDICISRSRKRFDQAHDTKNCIAELPVSYGSNKHVMSTAKKVFSSAALVKKVPQMSDSNRHVRYSRTQQVNYEGTQAEIMLNSKTSQVEIGSGEENDKTNEKSEPESIKSIVGYIGSIETPNSQAPLHSFRNTVRRLRMEKKIHSLVLMEVNASGVQLTNALGKQIALYPRSRIVSSVVCPDDGRYFGLVTVSVPEDKHGSFSEEEGCLSTTKSTCHLFMIDPGIRCHSAHIQQAQAFQTHCTTNPDTGQCEQFPESCTSILRFISSICCNNHSRKSNTDIIQHAAFPELVCQNSYSGSDTGSGFGKEEQVCVVDLSHGKEQMDSSILSFALNTSVASTQDSLVPETSRDLTPRHDAGSSDSVQECCQQDSENPLSVTSISADHPDLESAENQGFIMQSFSQLHHEHSIVEEEHISVTKDGQTALKSSLSSHKQKMPPTAENFIVPSKLPSQSVSRRSAFHQFRPASAPLGKHSSPETVDLATLWKLSPRALPHSSPSPCIARSPSVPPANLFPHRDSYDDEDDDNESENDPYLHSIQNSKDLRTFSDDCYSFPEHVPQPNKPHGTSEMGSALKKWMKKSASFKNPEVTPLKQSFGQSLECLSVSDVECKATKQLQTSFSINNIAAHSLATDAVTGAGRVALWAVQFDKLLKDPLGIAVFTEFLEREFSDENIRFWVSCEQFRSLSNDHELKLQAADIYAHFLSDKASDPINVDSTARSHAGAFLDNPTAEMFDVAQSQIFQLMRQDSYVRFLKSDIYKNKLMQELEVTDAESEKTVENKLSMNQDTGKEFSGKRRRRSILPWKHSRKSSKTVSDSALKDLNKKETEDAKSKSRSSKNVGSDHTKTISSIQSMASTKKMAGFGIDLSTLRREFSHHSESQARFCRIIMPDGSTTVVSARPGQTAQIVLSKLCEKRSLSMNNMDVFLLGSDTPLDLNEDISNLGSKEIVIERRVLFSLQLPNGKSIEIKSKPSHTAHDVLKPIVHKYGYSLSHSSVYLMSTQNFLDLEMPVAELENQKVVIFSNMEKSVVDKPNLLTRWPQLLSTKQNDCHLSSGDCLQEITNKIFEDLMHGKSNLAHGFHGVKAQKNKDLHTLGFQRKEAHKKQDTKRKTTLPVASDNKKAN